MNIAADVADDLGLDHWEYQCLELMDAVFHQVADDSRCDVLWVELDWTWLGWSYHCVPVVDGIVHDAWHPDAMLPPEEYVEVVFPGAPWELNPGADDE